MATLLRDFQQSCFRLETLQHYEVVDERFETYRSGQPLPPMRPSKVEWLQRVRDTVASGRLMHRVHVVDLPLTPYLQYELAVYPENVDAGEEVRIALRSAAAGLAALRQDFWLLDAETGHPAVVWIRYDSECRVMGHEVTEL